VNIGVFGGHQVREVTPPRVASRLHRALNSIGNI
jgi:hypothetical protein